jgi:WD40 repeat protein
MSSVIGSPDGYFSVWQLNPPNSSNDHWQPLDKAVSALVVHPNKPWIVTGDRGGLIKFWNLYQSPCVNVFHVEKEGYVKSLAFLNDGSILASGHNTNINIWDVKTGNKLSTIRNHKRPVVALTEMGKGILASGSDDCTVKIWNISNPTYPTMINTLDKVYKGAAFALAAWSEKILICGWADHSFAAWNIENNDYWESPKEHTHNIRAITICNERLITGSDDHTVKIWEKQ